MIYQSQQTVRGTRRQEENGLARSRHIADNLRWFEMVALLVNRHIDLAEFKFADDPQGLFQRIAGKTLRGTGNKHGCLPIEW